MRNRFKSTTTGVDITPAGIHVAAAGVRYIAATGVSLCGFPPDFLAFLFLDLLIFFHEYHLPLFR
jgi:hypothetical protein